MALQYGVPLEVLVTKFSHVRFEPSGFTKNPDIPMAKSLTDYIFRFLGSRFLVGPSARSDWSSVEELVARERAGAPRRRRAGVDAVGGSRSVAARGARRADRVQPAGRCAELPRLRRDHGAQRRLLQMPELRRHQRLLVEGVAPARAAGTGSAVTVREAEAERGVASGGLPAGGGGGPLGRGRGAPSGRPAGVAAPMRERP